MEAYLYEKLDDGEVECRLCHHACTIKPGRSGICGVRSNNGQDLISRVYGRLVAQNVDPIEKKPLYHFLPGSGSYSIATVGCNFKCRFCQNADIAQMPKDRGGAVVGSSIRPESVVADALRRGSQSIAYTYTEPTIYFEFAYDTARIAHQKGLRNVFVTNGYMSAPALEMIAPYLDAANVDLKAFKEDYYKTYCGARLEPVLDTLRHMKALGVWVEVTTLVVPGLNDDPDELQELAGFIAEQLGPETPWHISRFHPTYRMTDRPPTPLGTLLSACEIGTRAGLHYVYLGNVPGSEGANTHCHQCGQLLIERTGFAIGRNRIVDDRCPDCHAQVHGVGMGGGTGGR
ncbi:MAG: AmmeMemoRadiSam system radical SAM enzyme [Desulfobacteraceae bacterium]|jgi:pyruvate formate lyase activating enzyme